MYRLSYRAYFHNLDAVCMCVCACFGLFVSVYRRCRCVCVCVRACVGAWVRACVCVCVHVPVCVCTYCMCAGMLLSSEVVTALTAIPANGQIPPITPAVATKPTERLQFPPQTLGQFVEAERREGGGCWRDNLQPFSTIHSPHSTPLTHEWGSN